VRKNLKILPFLCIAVFLGIWIEKGMGLMLPGVIPTPVGEYAEYTPSNIEYMIVAGIWAFGFFALTILIKGATGIMLEKVKYQETTEQPSTSKHPGTAATA